MESDSAGNIRRGGGDIMRLTINGTSYHYEVYGKGIPLVLLHGFTGSTATWYPFIKEWQDSLQLILIDLPGHGKTGVRQPFSMKECCDDLKEIFTQLGLTSINLLGYSMGGRTALSFAMFYPEMIQSLILESSSPGLKNATDRVKRMKHDEKLASRIERKGVEAFVDFWEDIPLFHTQKGLPLKKQQAIRQERLAQTKEGLAASLRYMGTGSQPSWWNNLGEVSFPVLLLAGMLDEKFADINEEMSERFINFVLHLFVDTGHAIHVEQDENFGKIIKEFILAQEEK